MSEELASVVIPVGPDAERLGQCLERVMHQDYPRTEIIIVCDPRAADLPELPEGSEELRVIRERREGELGQLVNTGMRAARGHVKVLLMPYCVPVGAGWLCSMVEPFENGEVGVVVSQCFAVDGDRPTLGAHLLDCIDPQQRRNRRDRPVPQRTVSHACDAYRASLLADLGYFETRGLPPAGQAVDISLKLADAGYAIVLSQAAVAAYSPPADRRRLRGALGKALSYGFADALLDRLYELRWLNGGVFAGALAALALGLLGAVSLPVAVMAGIALFVWGAFLSLRLPLVGWELPVALLNFAAYVALIVSVRGDWRPGLFGRAVHPAIIRQWCWLAALVGAYGLIVAGAALRAVLRGLGRPRGLLYALPTFLLGILWWLLAGAGYLRGRLLAQAGRG